MILPPWAEGPFELIYHAELHFRAGEDFDRRIAMISFDNAIEVSITTYLSLHPIQRQNRQYQKAQVEQWLQSYHTKIDFLEIECQQRRITVLVQKSHIVHYHMIRNKQYHEEGGYFTPNWADLKGVRGAALWVFSTLYDVPNVEQILEERIADALPSPPPQREESLDRVIDNAHGMVQIAGTPYYASEVLFGIDATLYREMGLELLNSQPGEGVESE